MHTVMVIGGGIMLLGLFLLGASMMGGNRSSAARTFIPVWLVVALGNMWIGVTQAGYTVAAEFPIMLGVFAGPAALAFAASRFFASSGNR